MSLVANKAAFRQALFDFLTDRVSTNTFEKGADDLSDAIFDFVTTVADTDVATTPTASEGSPASLAERLDAIVARIVALEAAP